MALNALGRLEVVFRLVDESAPGVATARRNVQDLGKTAVAAAGQTRTAFLGAFPAFLTLGVLRQAKNALQGLLGPVIEFEDAMADMRVFARTTGESIDDFAARTRDDFILISRASQIALPEVIRGFTDLSKRGVETADAMAILGDSALLASIEHQDLTEVTRAAFSVMKAFGESGELGRKRLNQLAIAAAGSGIGIEELADIVTRTSSGVVQAQPVFEDFAFVLQKTRDVSQSAAIAGTQVRRAYEQLAKKMPQIAEQLGVSPVEKGTGRLRQMTDIMFDAVAAGQSVSRVTTELGTIVGTRAVIPFAALGREIGVAIQRGREMGRSTEEIRQDFFAARVELEDWEGTIARMHQQQMVSLRRQFELLGTDVGILATAFGENLTPAVSGIVGTLDRVTRLATSVVQALSSVSDTIPGFSLIASAIGRASIAILTLTAVTAAGRAMWQLYQGALSFAFPSVVGMGGAFRSLWADVTAANVAVGSSAVVATTASRAFTLLAGSVRILSSSFGAISLIAGLIAVLGPMFFDFGKDIDELQSLQSTGLRGTDGQIARLRAAGDEAGAQFLEAAKIIKDAVSKRFAALDPRLFSRAEEIFARLPGDFQKDFSGFRPTLLAVTEEYTNYVKQLQTTGTVEVGTRDALNRSLFDLHSIFVAAAAEGNKAAEEMAKQLEPMINTLSDTSGEAQKLNESIQAARSGGRAELEARRIANATSDEEQKIRDAEKAQAKASGLRSRIAAAGPAAAAGFRERGFLGGGGLEDQLALLASTSGPTVPGAQAPGPAGAAAAQAAAPRGRAAKTSTDDVVKAMNQTNSILRSQPTVRVRVEDLSDAQGKVTNNRNARTNVPEF